MQEIRKGLDAGVLREIFIGLENGLDVSGYANTEYNWQQMKEIRLGLEAGLDVSYYRSIQPMRCASDGFSWRRTRISSAIWKHRSSRRRRCSRIPKQLGDGTVDYRDVEWFEPVAKGQKLAFYHSAKQGENGTTIKGRVIPARRGRENINPRSEIPWISISK